MKLEPGARIYFMGIGGTGMASVAGLMQEAGYRISGSDKGVYPPMSDMLQQLGIEVKTPYATTNLALPRPDMIVVANALSRGNPEVEMMLEEKLPHVSFPALLGEQILSNRECVVVTGTHGKTTTTSLITSVLMDLGCKPGYLIGGIPRDFSRSFSLGEGEFFVIEGDEYDTAFFDKGPKFLHYRPKYAILNNLEFDHADIYANLEAIQIQFAKFVSLLADPSHIIANGDDPNILKVLRDSKLQDRVTVVSPSGTQVNASVRVKDFGFVDGKWQANLETKAFGPLKIKTALTGAHNIANIAQCVALLGVLAKEGRLPPSFSNDRLQKAIEKFAGVKRRLDLLAKTEKYAVYEDFAHHPTAIRLVIESFRQMHPQNRLLVAFEPANATGRRSVLLNDFADALQLADQVFIGKCPVDQRIAESERMDTRRLAELIGKKARSFGENEELFTAIKGSLKEGDCVIFMSPSSFSGVQHRLARDLLVRS